MSFAFVVGTAFLGACNAPQKEPEPVVPVQVTAARRGAISQIVSAEAVVFPLQQAIVTPKISSTIKSFLVQRGSRVRQGQLLAILENADLSAAAEQSKGEFEQAEAGYVTTTDANLPEQIQKAELEAAAAKTAFGAQEKIYDSRKGLFQQGALPRRDLDAAEVALAQSHSQNVQAQKQLEDLRRVGKEQTLKSAGGQLSAAKGKFQGAQAQLSYSQIRSPIDGVVTDRPLYPGELATANQPLLTVMNVSRVIAKAHIAQGQAAQLKIRNIAKLQVPGVADPIEGRVSLVSPTLDPGSTTVEVWVEVTKPPAELKPGMTVPVEISASTAMDAVVVPASSVFQSVDGSDYVLLAGSDGIARLSPVKIGIRGDSETQITSGVRGGDLVISSGGYALPDKTRFKVDAPAPNERETPGGGEAGKAEKE